MTKMSLLRLFGFFVLSSCCCCDALVIPSRSSRMTSTTTPPTTLKMSLLDDSWNRLFLSTQLDEPSKAAVAASSKAAAAVSSTTPAQDGIVGILNKLSTDLNMLFDNLSWWQQTGVVLIPFGVAALTTLWILSNPPSDYRNGAEPYPRGRYDPAAAREYYKTRPLLVVRRALQLLRLSNTFLYHLAYDKYILRDEEVNRGRRAQELLQLMTQLGPTAIKVGQALSVRPDIVPTEYADALATLQDRVPPFSGAEAKLAMEKYGKNARQLDISFNKDPVASASIGQVYKAAIGDDQFVAVKIQRPNVLSEIALDLYLVREFAPLYQKLTGAATDLQVLANEWGRGFIAELDYHQEAQNTMYFNREMQKRNLNAVTAPNVLEEYSTEQVLVTEWMDGTRLDESNEDDVPRLCSVALNAYLVMLLELQSLHCDPHPGNLLRTPEGRLCILDFGMTLQVEPDLQYALLEYIAHITSDDYDKVPDDLVKMGFLKEDKLEFARRTGFLEPLIYFLKQAGQGGGANGVRERIFAEFREKYPGLSDDDLRIEMRSEMRKQMQEMSKRESVATGITVEVEELQRRNRESFTIPPWFLYTTRAFATLEGVSLQSDPNYSIVKSCFPYIAKRLVQDDHPRAQKALKDLIYGAGNAIDVDRITDLADGFSSYTTTTKTINAADTNDSNIMTMTTTIVAEEEEKTNKLVQAEAAITLAKDSADVLLAEKGNLVQDLIVQESALATSAQVKDSLRQSFVDAPRQFRDSLPFGMGALLPPLPTEEIVAPFVEKTPAEAKAQELAQKLALVLQQVVASPPNNNDDNDNSIAAAVTNALQDVEPEQAALVVKEVRENLPKYVPLVGNLGSKFASTLLKTASNNIESTLEQVEDELLKATAKTISDAAKQGAEAIWQQPEPQTTSTHSSTKESTTAMTTR